MCKEDLLLALILPCKHIFCFLCIKGHCLKNGANCFICKMSFDKSLIEKPPSMEAVREGSKDKNRWYYESNNNGWWEFDGRTSDVIFLIIFLKYLKFQIIEDAFRQEDPTVSFPIGSRTYEINFEAKRQYQQDDTSKKRTITRSTRRDIKNLRGVAGIPLEEYNQDHDSDG